LNDVLAVFADQSVGFSGGRILLHDASDARITIYEHPTEQIYHAQGFIVAGVIQGANMAFRRQALVDIDGFDDNIGAGTPFTFEDVDAELRALAAGWIGKYDPRSVVYHHHGRKPGIEVEALSRVYDTARGAYYMKCILFMPQRWVCLRHWLRCIKRQPFALTLYEAQSAIRYFYSQFKRKPNVTY
jgi:GT2 family glycosyltransferase